MTCLNCGMTKDEHDNGLAYNWHLDYDCSGYVEETQHCTHSLLQCPECGGAIPRQSIERKEA